MALEKLKRLFNPEVNTGDLDTESFILFLRDHVPGSGYERMKQLQQGIAINGSPTLQDQKMIDELIDVTLQHIPVSNPDLFRDQLGSYLRTGEIHAVTEQKKQKTLFYN